MLTLQNQYQHQQQPPPSEQDVSVSVVKNCRSDFRELYSYSKTKKSGSLRSLSSFTTDRSSATCVTSNTTRAKERKKHQRRKFRAFANWLMKFLEKKDPRVFGEAQAVIRDCEQRKKRGEKGYESVTDSLKEPLREVVGPSYWKEAQLHLNQFLSEKNHPIGSFDSSSRSLLNDHTPMLTLSRSESSATSVSKSQQIQHRPAPRTRADLSPLSTKSNWNLLDEKKLRRERFYMLLRLLMKYLELSNRPLYIKAKQAIDDCIARNEKHEEGYESLSESIKRTVKQVVGDTNWRKAESYLAKAILQQAHNDAMEECWSREEFTFEPIPDDQTIGYGNPNHEDEFQGGAPQYFVNACHAFSTSAKRTIEEQAMMITATATSLCLKQTVPNEMESVSASLERKRRRLQTLQDGRLRT